MVDTLQIEIIEEVTIIAAKIIEEVTVLDVEISGKGPAGPAGPIGAGGGSSFTLPTNSDLGGNRVIATVSEFAVYADSSANKPAIGITTGASVSGVDCNLQSGGKMAVSGMSWTPDSPIFLGVNGLLTQTEPVSGFSQLLGYAHNAETILIEIGQPINLVV